MPLNWHTKIIWFDSFQESIIRVHFKIIILITLLSQYIRVYIILNDSFISTYDCKEANLFSLFFWFSRLYFYVRLDRNSCVVNVLFILLRSARLYVSRGIHEYMCFTNNRITLKKMFGIRFAYCYWMASVHRWRYCNKHIQLIHLCSRSQNIYFAQNLQFSIGNFPYRLIFRCFALLCVLLNR